MWRSLRRALPKSKVALKLSSHRLYSSSASSKGGSNKIILGIIASTSVGFAGAIVYGKYDPKFKNSLEGYIPYINYIYKIFPEEKESEKPAAHVKRDIPERKGVKDDALSSSLLRKKLEREKISDIGEVPKLPIEPKSRSSNSLQVKDDKINDESNVLLKELKQDENHLEPSSLKEDLLSYENVVSDTIEKLKKSSADAVHAQINAGNAVKFHTEKLYEALDLSEGKDNDIIWTEAKAAVLGKEKALKIAKQKAADTKYLIEKLDMDIKKLKEKDSNNPLLKIGKEEISKYTVDLEKAESEVLVAQLEAKTAAEYEDLVNSSKEEFRQELQIILPNYLEGDKDKTMTEPDLNLLIAHAHRRIEKLQKQIAKQQVTEKLRLDQAVKGQRMQDEQLTESIVQAELEKRKLDLEKAVENRVASLKANFEADLRQQLLRQAAAHTDHLEEVLKIKEEELERKHVLELEAKLLHQKGVFVSEVSGNMARLRGILDFLKARSDFDTTSKKAQGLLLACQSLNYKVTLDKYGSLSPLARNIAAIKNTSDDSDFIDSVLSSIPSEAVNRGVYTNEALKTRFEKVKRICRKVALCDENNDSLYRYFLSYLESLLIVDNINISKNELEGLVAVDTSELDTFDILSRISHSLKIDEMEQALRYANQLKGEPRAVANDWMNEMQLLLETQLAVKALLAHAAAVGVQAYH